MIKFHYSLTKPRVYQGLQKCMTRACSALQLQTREEDAGPETLAGKFDWKETEKIWSKIITVKKFEDLPNFVRGDGVYGFTDLQAVQRVGEQGEFLSKSTVYTRHRTYAIQIGYMGSAYEFGYQRQRLPNGKPEPRTVELDIYAAIQETEALGSFRRVITIAGRTDKYVSAVSQVFNFVHSDAINPADLLQKLRQTEPARSGRLIFHDCARVPRAFNARASAQWRRYLYLVPLELKSTPAAAASTTATAAAADGIAMGSKTVDVDFVNKVFGQLEGLELPYNSFAVGRDRKSGEGMMDFCRLYRARAFEVSPTDLPGGTGRGHSEEGNASRTAEDISSGGKARRFMCVELVGSRFLRRMVRLLVATAVREAVEKADADRNINVLQDICTSNDRLRRALPFPGSGLCFAGCGYDVRSLAFYKQQRKEHADSVREQFARDDLGLGLG